MITKREKTAAVLRTLLIGVIALFFTIPLIWMVCTSLKTDPEVFAKDWQWLPKVAQWRSASRTPSLWSSGVFWGS